MKYYYKMEDKIKQLKQKIEEISKELDELTHSNENNKEKMDFSKWIGRKGEDLCIFGEKMLHSVIMPEDNISILYDDVCPEFYEDSVDYEVIEEKYLEYGDIIIDDRITNPTLEDFGVFMGRHKPFFYVQYICQRGAFQLIESHIKTINPDRKLKRFLRE